MPATIAELPAPTEEPEAFRVLVGLVGSKATKVPAEALARHVMRIVPAEEWPVRAEALDALLRRVAAARKDELRLERRPEEGAVLGAYATRRKGSGSRPYQTVLAGVDPLAGRCDCPDYLKSSLGLCKHLFAVLEHVFARPALHRRALKEQSQLADEPPSGFRWDPVRPLLGFGDWLERVSWAGPKGIGAAPDKGADLLPRLRPGPSPGWWTLRSAFRDRPEKRLELVEALLKAVPAAARTVQDDPALRALLVQERDRLTRLQADALGPAEIRAAIRGLKVSLYPYQKEGVTRFLQAGRLLLADDMGLGKTAQAIACCEILRRTGKVRRGLIIAPAALKPQWGREWARFSDLPIEIVDCSPAERKALYGERKEGFFIINYEQLLRDLDLVHAWKPELVVLDEAQRIKNWATKTALTVKGLTPAYRLVLTGTPMENRVEELASIVEWVDDMALEPKWRLPALHAIRSDGRKEVTGVRNLETIRTRLRPSMVRRVRQEVLDQLPPRTDTRIPVEMTAEQMEEHEALNQPIAALVSISYRRPLTQVEFLRLMSLLTTQRIISNGLAQHQFKDVWPDIRRRRPEERILRELGAPKLQELRQLVRQVVLDQGRKAVIFSQWRRMLLLAQWAVADILAEQHLRSGFFTGAEPQKRRTENIVNFHDDDAFRVLFASDAGGVGLNLQRAANCVINLELPWNPAVLEQRIGRVYRLGQKQPIDVFNLVAEQGIESRIADLVGNKQAFFKGLFDGDSDSIRFDQSGSFLSRVQKLYDPEGKAAAAGAARGDEPADLPGVDPDGSPDDSIDDPYEEMIEAGDEALDRDEPASALAALSPEAGPLALPAPGAPSAPPDAESPPAQASEAPAPVDGEAARPPGGSAAAPSMGEVRELFSRLQVRRGEAGKIVIEAPADAATTLGALFEGMAALLQAAAKAEG
ncbi:ATP-dependent helicase HepA [Aquisphaera giovannonii]|uniref:ATP-dependent helicase HepA n=1 Tax=Aquisphaera giovannonii TaxID=406548 RepID=A0A5B9W058_9BACT|nr:DEAD/DEAH box helicase [Aquisphaera giovannonii]QEH33903.1 ATP-dependent helicase HepA [Aquisphaera giovannonii]